MNKNNIKQYSGYSSFGSLLVEEYNRAVRDLLKRPVFEKGDDIWIDVLPTKTKQYNNRVHSSTKLTPIRASLKNTKDMFTKSLLDKLQKGKPTFQINNVVRVADLKKTFSKGDTTIWSYKLYKITDSIKDTIPSYKIDKLPERYNEALLKKIEVRLKENDKIRKKLFIT